MRLRCRVSLICFLLLLPLIGSGVASGVVGGAEKMSLGFFASLNQEHKFWMATRAFQEAVAEDLRISSRWYYADSNQVLALNQIVDATSAKNSIQGAMVTDLKGQGKLFLGRLDESRVPTISFVGFDFAKIGLPRETFKYWIGAVRMDEVKIGHMLTSTLVAEAERLRLRAADGKIHILAITGDPPSALARQRASGLEKFVAENWDSVVLDQLVTTTNWSADEGYYKVNRLLRRYPRATVVWAANDDIALGALKAAKESGRHPGKDILLGGIDWVPEAVQKINVGELVCSIGGVAFQAGWSTILLYDYLHGKDFRPELGPLINIEPVLLTKKNVKIYLRHFANGNWRQVDFTRFSKSKNPALKKYDFSYQHVLESIGPPTSLQNK